MSRPLRRVATHPGVLNAPDTDAPQLCATSIHRHDGPVPTPTSPELADPIIVDFPLRGGGWVAVTSPADRVPSHGTDQLGQRFAFDFLRVDDRPGLHPHPARTLQYLLLGGRTREAYAWDAAIHSPFDGIVVGAADGREEPAWLHPVRDLVRMVWNGFTFTPDRLPAILGNHVILRDADRRQVFAGFAHLIPGSVAVQPGDRVAAGDLIGRVGHTGNSTSPHLHFQLMDSPDLLTATGLPCAFRGCEVLTDGEWVPAEAVVPGRTQRVRSR